MDKPCINHAGYIYRHFGGLAIHLNNHKLHDMPHTIQWVWPKFNQNSVENLFMTSVLNMESIHFRRVVLIFNPLIFRLNEECRRSRVVIEPEIFITVVYPDKDVRPATFRLGRDGGDQCKPLDLVNGVRISGHGMPL